LPKERALGAKRFLWALWTSSSAAFAVDSAPLPE
jgi:hypothetical protein